MLTAPLVLAALSAGLLGGAHCIGMCGGIANMLTSAGKKGRKIIPIIPAQAGALTSKPTPEIAPWRTSTLLHAGRIFTYTLMGGLTGSIGAAGMRIHPFLPVHTLMYIIGNLALIWLGLRLFGYTPHFAPLDRLVASITAHIHLSPRFSLMAQTQRYPFIVGMAWGLLPCGLVYGVLPFALLSGDALSGAVLMLIFGLGALPYLLFAQGMAQWLRHSRVPALLRILGGIVLTSIGIVGLWWSFNMTEMPSFLCVTPAH
jgi:sulfite exporter TauE/SafE